MHETSQLLMCRSMAGSNCVRVALRLDHMYIVFAVRRKHQLTAKTVEILITKFKVEITVRRRHKTMGWEKLVLNA